MLLKVRTIREKLADNEFRDMFVLYDHVSHLIYSTKCYRIADKDNAISEVRNAIPKNIIRILSNGEPENWDYKVPFPYNRVSFIDDKGQNIQIIFNTEAYICNDNGDTIERIYGY